MTYKNKQWLEQKYWDEELCLREIAEICGVVLSTIKYWMIKLDVPRRNRSEAKLGDKNHKWKGDDITYGNLHNWIATRKPKPKKCEFCGKKTKKLELSSKTHKYRRDIDEFQYLCRKCHTKYDFWNFH